MLAAGRWSGSRRSSARSCGWGWRRCCTPAELPGDQAIPPEGAIDEAVETAKQFCGADAPGFVNGILGTVLRERMSSAASSALKRAASRSDSVTVVKPRKWAMLFGWATVAGSCAALFELAMSTRASGDYMPGGPVSGTTRRRRSPR